MVQLRRSSGIRKFCNGFEGMILLLAVVWMASSLSSWADPLPDPGWWTDDVAETRIIDAQAQTNPYAPVTLGQLKHVAAMARKHMDVELAAEGGAGTTIDSMVNGFDTQTSANLTPVNLGQLKAVAKPFYDRLMEVQYDTTFNLVSRGYPSEWEHDYPWDPQTPVSENYHPANQGQLKMVFSFDLSMAWDSENPLPEWWQLIHFGQTGVDPSGDASGNTFSNLWHFENYENPFDYFLDDEPTIVIDSGDGQIGHAGTILPQTLRVLIEVDEQPSINAPVVFEVTTGLGLVRDPSVGGAWGKRVTVRTDANGHAEVQFKLPFALDDTAQIDVFPDVFKSTPPEVFFEAFTLEVFEGGRLAAGSSHSVALDSEGQVWTWGYNNVGQLGDGSSVDRWFPQVVPDLDPVIQISAGYHSTYALLDDGTVKAWGSNSSGQLGDDTQTDRSTPVEVEVLSSIIQIAGGSEHALALDEHGKVWSWGLGNSGQLGHGNTSNELEPLEIDEFDDVVQVSAGYRFSAAVKENGTVWTWGLDSYDKLGRSGSTTSPAQVGSHTDVIRVSLGRDHAIALLDDGTVRSWGRNQYGQLGDGSSVSSTPNPVQVEELTDIVWIEAGQYHSLALDKDGTLWAWGRNEYGYLGDGGTTSSNVPVEVGEFVLANDMAGFAAGGEHSLGITDDGTLWGWGRNNHGQLGDGGNDDSSDPVEAVLLTFAEKVIQPSLSIHSDRYLHGIEVESYVATPGAELRYTLDGSLPTEMDSLWPSSGELEVESSTFLRVRAFSSGMIPSQAKTATYRIGPTLSAGSSHSVVLDAEGQVWTWGSNNNGQLGHGSIVDKWFPQMVPDLDPVIQISAGYHSTYALLDDGTVKAWGSNNFGQLGDDTETDRSTPVEVEALSSIIQIAGGSDHALALDEHGKVWSWGRGGTGQLGHGNTSNELKPLEIDGFDGVVQVAAGFWFSGAVKDDGTVWMWGSNSSGKLGVGNSGGSPLNVPTQIGGVYDIIRLSLGRDHALALRGDGTVWAWGNNFYGQLGNGTDGNSSSTPVQVSNLTDIVWIEAGNNHSLALDSNGTLWAWGRNQYGRLGDGDDENSNVPVEVGEFVLTNDMVSFAAGGEHSLGITDDGTIWGWGRNNHGQLGDGSRSDSSNPVEVVLLTFAEKVLQPSLSVFSGQYLDGIEVESFVATPGAELRYTLDGSMPTEMDSLWPSSGGLEIESSTILRIRAFASGMLPSDTRTATYRIGPSVTAGSTHSVALDGEGRVWTWGNNETANLGDGNSANDWLPHIVDDLAPVIQISAGLGSIYALLTDRTVKSWGRNGNGELGIGTQTPQSSPAQVSNLSDIHQIAGGNIHALALDIDGKVWSWGQGTAGQLGHGNNDNELEPLEIDGFNGVVQVAAGSDFSGAVKDDGTVWMWGSNSSGKLGGGISGGLNVPTQIGGVYDIIRLSFGLNHALALRGDGTVWAWGHNSYGQLGNGTDGNNSSTPVQVSDLTDIVWIEAGNNHSLALDSSGKLWAWGFNQNGRLGKGDYENSNVPVPITPLIWDGHSILTMAAGGMHSLSIIDYLGVPVFFAWGNNNRGQLGLDKSSVATSKIPVIIPWPIDSDNDGLFDYEEFLHGFDPNNPDTTGIGFGDYVIHSLGLDPNNNDWNGSGISNADEIAQGGNPFPSGFFFFDEVDWPGFSNDLGEPDPNDQTPPHLILLKPVDAIEL